MQSRYHSPNYWHCELRHCSAVAVLTLIVISTPFKSLQNTGHSYLLAVIRITVSNNNSSNLRDLCERKLKIKEKINFIVYAFVNKL